MKDLIIVRGGGDMATGVIHRLWSAGFEVMALETDKPVAVRRRVAVSEAVYDGTAVVEDMKAVLIHNASEARGVLAAGNVPVLVDPQCRSIMELKPAVLVDAIIAKRNTGLQIDMAPVTIALGPGFFAGEDADYVIETNRGHNLGRIIKSGTTSRNTRTPGNIGGYTMERVIRAEHSGLLHVYHDIGEFVEKGETVAAIENEEGSFEYKAELSGIIRGMLRDDFRITKGTKIADIDPRKESYHNCFTISDKARCIAGSVLELVCRYRSQEDKENER
ncbi:MAG: selenium-dependent molybdenum cofactor biosynthesis protein YqeB [Bacillota bacterium]|nr:selenium-dependent molybdenum cofactor biosynthesis protein YqeB [Bacillota bacterium]